MNMDNENTENIVDNAQFCDDKIQNDLLKLMRVLDDCIENVDNFYCYTMKKKMLLTSNDN